MAIHKTGLLLIWGVFLGSVLAAAEFPLFDFTTPEGLQGWQAAHDIAKMQPTMEGLAVRISGVDPYVVGAGRDYPAGTNLWLHLRLKSDQGGVCQVFYYRTTPTEQESVRFAVPGGQWFEAQVSMAALGPGWHLRIDPPGSGGTCVLGKLWFTERLRFQAPTWPKPDAFTAARNALTLESGALILVHNRNALGEFEVRVAGQPMAAGNSRAMIGYLREREVRWLSLADKTASRVTVQSRGQSVVATARRTDPDGGRWEIEQRFSPGRDGTIAVETRVAVDRDRAVLYLPMLTLMPGLGSYGTNKSQALFAGVEYLENEPSSSEADLIGPESKRQVPDSLKVTFPLMAIQTEGRYLGLMWEPQPSFVPAFDSPDRLFNSGGHLMSLLFPGSDGVNREEGNLMPYKPQALTANQPLVLRATLVGDLGTSVVPAVQKYVKLSGLPAIPNPGLSAPEYFQLAAHGWLDSNIRVGDKYRHAVWEGFGAQPASDAALWMEWLATKVTDLGLAAGLINAANGALAQVSPANYNGSQIGHIRYPLPALVFGAVAENADQALAHGRALLDRFQADGSLAYQAPAKGVDYGKTHWSREANGLTAATVSALLEAAAFAGDRDLLRQAVQRLRAMNKFKDTVPRGAQTWEVPLHTPDILASGYLVRAYMLGYELTGDSELLEQARYWAWTGVPFVYLTAPTDRPVGLYSTIPVLGATGWTAPVWIGLPVQWCGLVYGDALYRLARHEPTGPWKQLADGIAVGGVQHTWPLSDPGLKGLLPDSFQLRSQMRSGPAINPGTVLAPALKYYRRGPVYDFRSVRRHGLLIHAAGEIRDLEERGDGVEFTAVGWPQRRTWLLINGVWKEPRVRIDGKVVALDAPHSYDAAKGHLILAIKASARIGITL